MKSLLIAVPGGLQEGKSIGALTAAMTMDQYSDWLNNHEWRELNERGMTRHLLESGLVE